MGKFEIKIGDITSDEILEGKDLVVNATNPYMVSGSGIAGAIFKKAGELELESYTEKHYKTEMKIGEIRITPGFDLKMDIMFVQGPKKWSGDDSYEILKNTYRNMLKEIQKNNYKHVLFPSLGTGVYGFTHEEVGKDLSLMMKAFVQKNDINLTLVLFNEEDKKHYL